MRFVLICTAIFIATIIGFHTILTNGSLLNFLDNHPDNMKVPPVEFVVGEGYYVFGDLENSATYYQRISDRYPDSAYADDAYFNYLQDLDDMNIPRFQMADAYATYIDKFPKGDHVDVVQKRIEYCRNNR